MPDFLKEMRDAQIDAYNRLSNADIAQRHYRQDTPGRTVGSTVAFSGGAGTNVQGFVTTGYDAVNGVTVLPFTLGLSVLGP